MNRTSDVDALLHRAAHTTWDAIVIGAGPAGALAARQTGSAGLTTLLVDAKHFPREKVCGGYLNRRALDVLQRTGLRNLVINRDQDDVDQLELIWRGRKSHFRLPPGKVICRTTFDKALLESARDAGATILTGDQAVVEPKTNNAVRCVTVACNGEREILSTRVVICADGLARTSSRHLPEFTASTATDSRVGIGAIIVGELDASPAGQITMVLSRHGYVGISRVNSQQFNVAAAVDRALLLEAAPVEIVATMLTEAEIPIPSSLMRANWRGTPPLTSRPLHVASERVFLIGDAGGYVEPFTGEGMAAALEAAVAVAPLAIESAEYWVPSIANRWEVLHRQIVRDRQSTCRQLAWILRRPLAAQAALNICRVVPRIAERLIAKTSIPSTLSMPPEISAT